jgi:SagB-type dehydrogenase family enzyme
MSRLSPAARRTFCGLAEHALAESDIDSPIADADGLDALSHFYFYLTQLGSHRMLRLHTAPGNGAWRPLATLEPISPYFVPRRVMIHPEQCYRLSRFAYLHQAAEGSFCLESPLSHALVRLMRGETASLVHALARGGVPEELARESHVEGSECEGFLELLAAGDFIGVPDQQGAMPEDRDLALKQWEFHDLLFHTRSRMGRHSNPTGGRFRFLGKIPPQPAVKSGVRGAPVYPLARPDLAAVRAADPTLEAVMDARKSDRRLAPTAITVTELGEFLFRVARVKSRFTVDDKGEFTSRPYPSGGASYELELYLTVDQCVGLPRGFYWYDPVEHALHFLRGEDEDTRAMLLGAHQATAALAWPAILITIAARFQRVSWKYDAMAYATILKNTGVLYAMMYLVATAMGLAPCGIGLGDSDRFARLAGTDYYQEGSVGEFILAGGRGRGL